MEELGFHWTDFQEIWCLSIFKKSAKKIKVLLKSDDDDDNNNNNNNNLLN
jgi:hypothetical protein